MPRSHRLFAVLFLATIFGDLAFSSATAQEEKRKFKRRDDSSAEDLRKQLQVVPEVGFDQGGAAVLYAALRETPGGGKTSGGKGGKGGGGFGGGGATPLVPSGFGVRFYSQLAANYKKPDWIALPWRTGLDCQLGKETAERLHAFSLKLRLCMRQSVPADDVRLDADKLRDALAGAKQVGGKGGRNEKFNESSDKPFEWGKAEAVPTIVQMLQTENAPIRELMVELLRNVKGKDASVALAQRAVFDLSPEVREKAVEALESRPTKEFQQVLLDAMRWPWAPAADRAAETIVALQLKGAVPDLVQLLQEPNPRIPFTNESKTKKGGASYLIREVVRVNHLSNCCLCHALSTSKDDLVRGRIPVPGEDPPPQYYQERTGMFVRADITYLRQDFSVVQPVANSGKWPGFQRFDYLLRTRKATNAEVKLFDGLQKEKKLGTPYTQRDAILFALREVTGRDLGSRPEGWLQLLNPIEGKRDPKEEKQP